LIVADASLVARLLVVEAETPLAKHVYARDPVWFAPKLVQSEIRSFLLQQMRLRGLLLSDAELLLRQAETLVSPVDMRSHGRAILRRATDLELSAYDAEYVVLAEAIAAPLVTFDSKLVRATPQTSISPLAFFEADEINEPMSFAGEAVR
jgi:predicted nucleic acid-binding protein